MPEMIPPDPEPDDLPDPAVLAVEIQAETAGRILRAALKGESSVESLKARMKSDMAAWQEMIAKAELRAETLRTIVRDWMLRTGTTKIQAPWFTASIGKGRTKLVVSH